MSGRKPGNVACFPVIVTLIAALVSTSMAFAMTDAEIEEAIRDVLVQRHPIDTAEWWRSLGPSAPKVMISMYENSNSVYHRLRLIEALGWFDDSRAVEFVKQQVETSEDDVIRNGGIKSVGRSQGEKELDFVSKYLDHKDPQTRLAAAETIKRMDGERSKKVYEKYLRDEKAPWIRQKLRGEYPRDLKPMTPVASSESKAKEAEPVATEKQCGKWSGVWVVPADGAQGMLSQVATADIRKDGSGELVIKPAGTSSKKQSVKDQRLIFSGVRNSRSEKLQGEISAALSAQTARQSAPSSAPVHGIDGEVYEFNASDFIEIRVRGMGAVFMGRKQKSSDR